MTGWFLFITELRLHLRHSREWLYPVAFFCIVISLFPLGLTPNPSFLQKYIPGCVWIAALLASLLSVEKLFVQELEEGQMEQLLLSQMPLTLFLIAKLFAQWLVTELPLILLTPIIGLLFHLSTTCIIALCLSLLVGTPILILIGSLGVALTLGLQQPGVFMSLLILPLVIPVLIFGVTIVGLAQASLPIAGPLSFLAGLCLLAITFIPWAIAATLRVSLDN